MLIALQKPGDARVCHYSSESEKVLHCVVFQMNVPWISGCNQTWVDTSDGYECGYYKLDSNNKTCCGSFMSMSVHN